MMNALAKWTFGVTAGLLAIAVAIAMTTEQAWADSCSGTTIGHGTAACLTVAYANSRQTLTLTSECSGLSDVTAQVRIINLGPDGPIIYLQELYTSTPFISHVNGDATYTNARCCPSSGICDITDCDTTDGVIDDSTHAAHCRLINDTTGVLTTADAEITNGVLIYTDPPPADGS